LGKNDFGKAIANTFSKLFGAIKKNRAEIYIGFGTASMVASTVLAAKAAPTASEAIKQAEEEKGDKLTFIEKVKTTWKFYIPAAGTGVIGVAGIGAGTHSFRKQRKELQAKNVSLGLALGAAEAGIAAYQNEVKERLGDEAAEEIFDKAKDDAVKYINQQERVNEKNPTIRDVDDTGDGDQLFYDPLLAQFFRSSKAALNNAAAQTNALMSGGPESQASYNDFLDYANRRRCDLAEKFMWYMYGDLHGSDGYGPVWLHIVNRGVTAPWGEPALSMEFERNPTCLYPYR